MLHVDGVLKSNRIENILFLLASVSRLPIVLVQVYASTIVSVENNQLVYSVSIHSVADKSFSYEELLAGMNKLGWTLQSSKFMPVNWQNIVAYKYN